MVIFFFKNFALLNPQISHTGLGISAQLTANTLARNGYNTRVEQLRVQEDLPKFLDANVVNGLIDGDPLTNVILCAPWIDATVLAPILQKYRLINFVVVCHSDVGFLAADTGAVARLRELSNMTHFYHNFFIAGNSQRLVSWARIAYQAKFIYLPNLYDIETFQDLKPWYPPMSPVKIGCYGAYRPLKNHMTAAAAAVQLAETHRYTVEFHISGGRDSPGTNYAALRQMLQNYRINLVVDNWAPWPMFRRIIATMNILFQPSYTESFNIITADGIAECVPSVVSETIDWVPPNWICPSFSAYEFARTANNVLNDPMAASDGQTALANYVKGGIAFWKKWLAAPTV